MLIEMVDSVRKYKTLGTALAAFSLVAISLTSAGHNPANASGFSSSKLTSEDEVNRTSVSLTTPERKKDAITDPVVVAKWFLANRAAELSLDPTELILDRVIPGVSESQTIRFSQTLSGLPIPGSLIAITLDKNLDLVAYDTVTVNASNGQEFRHRLSIGQARRLLENGLTKTKKMAINDVEVTRLIPVVAFSSLVPGIKAGHHLAWQSWTSDSSLASTAVTYLDDATGNLLGSFPIVRHITNEPNVCDLQQISISDYQGQSRLLGSTLVYKSGSKFYLDDTGQMYPLCGKSYTGRGVASTQVARDHIDATWSYFKNVLDVDINDEAWLGNISQSIDGDSKPRISAFTNICLKNSSCPKYENAFWVPWNSTSCRSGACSGIFMGAGFDLALDVIAHELTHGVTFATSFSGALYEKSEAAALSESLSDIFGQAAERLTPTSLADPDWEVGEMVNNGDNDGSFRLMRSPDISTVTSNWKPADSHTNNGPGNRFAWLVANGGNFGGTTISPIGDIPEDGTCPTLAACSAITRLSTLVYSALPKLTSSSSYFDFGKAIMNSCQTLLTLGEDGFTANSCLNVARALRVTGISKIRISNLTTITTIPRNTRMAIKGSVRSLTGADVYKQPMQLTQLVKGKWVKVLAGDATCKRYCTDANNRVTFYVKWSKSATYRISTNTDFGAVVGYSSLRKVRVR